MQHVEIAWHCAGWKCSLPSVNIDYDGTHALCVAAAAAVSHSARPAGGGGRVLVLGAS